MSGGPSSSGPLTITLDPESFRFRYGPGVFGPVPELRRLDDIRPSLANPDASGPEELYVIAMDVGLERDRKLLIDSGLLLGVVGFAAGTVGDEPVRSQGHVHRRSAGSGASPPEVFEIWRGSALIYMQESVEENPGRCFAVRAFPGDVVVCPPGWGHMVVNADPGSSMVFGAICDRYHRGFDYGGVRTRGGLAYHPKMAAADRVAWVRNENYAPSALEEKSAETYWFSRLMGEGGIYRALQRHPEAFAWVPDPSLAEDRWEDFIP